MSSARALMGRAILRAQPWLLRRGETVWRPLRAVRPVLRIGGMVVLTRHEDVRTVLERDDAFGVTYAGHMAEVTGPFILGMDDSPRYRAEVAALREAAPASDLPFVAELTRERARAELAGGAVDGVALADAAVGAGIDRYLGLPALAGAAEREAARDVFRAVFLDGDTPAVMEQGKRASARLIAAIEEQMRRGPAPDTVLARLMDGPLSDADVPRNLVGLIAAWAASLPRAFALALDVLLDHPADLGRAMAAAADGDEQTLTGLWLEALRLQPQAPFLTRRCRSEVVVAPGAAREERLKPGDVVFAVTSSAMRDRHVLDRPEALVPERARAELLHFGAGMHRCFGARISEVQFGVLAGELLRRPVHRAGPLRWGPAFPAALPLRRG